VETAAAAVFRGAMGRRLSQLSFAFAVYQGTPLRRFLWEAPRDRLFSATC
jgi:hypothetical protein